jgi:hypothetical protein
VPAQLAFGPFSSQCRAGNLKILRGPWNEDLLRVLEGFPDLAQDDEIDACSGALDMLNPEMKGWGIYEFYRQKAEQLQQRKSSWVRLRAPPGIGAVETLLWSAPQHPGRRHYRYVRGRRRVPYQNLRVTVVDGKVIVALASMEEPAG